MNLPKYSIGIGDRFGHQGQAQLQAIMKAKEQGLDIGPVWNKSHREHTIIGTSPVDTRKEADAAVKTCGWTDSYFVDADHVNMANVDAFVEHCDFFTIDVADYIGQKPSESDLREFVEDHRKYLGTMTVPGIGHGFEITEELIERIACGYLAAVRGAGEIYRHIAEAGGSRNFVTEVSMDEAEIAQSPIELFFILSAIAREGVPVQTIAPKFSGRFNKGVDYVGDVNKFAEEFAEDVAVIDLAVKEFSLSRNLKLSVHSGSDKFSLYPVIREVIRKFDVGIHIKTAGTTWLEELIGLAMAGGVGLALAKEVYREALGQFDELCKPYSTVIDIDKNKLPTPEQVDSWDGERFAQALRHDPSCRDYNPHLRQLLHVGYKIAAQMGIRYCDNLEDYADIIGRNVTENIYNRHIVPLFIE